ncbi:putative MFS-type transporter YfcJ [Sporomusa acidovorans DSM 3132]|uniref:MFS-type transporter YfcJ n=2 Tax=Sporomusa TaxID=2375 RepID=A0ABZ3IZ59_SPOA4|nr:multidrug resistance protein MdtL [Sporomusa acidovorans DSM 3132]SDF19963.1 Predicted arabinose efflux permease, MFS family [Sporomusa acidovorans]
MTTTISKLWTKDFILFTISNTFLFSGFHIFLPTLPIYILNQGGTSTDVGLLSAIFVFCAILIRFFTDYGIKKWGKKYYLYIGCILCFIAALSYILATTVPRLLSLRVVHGLGFGIATTLYAAIVTDLIPKSRRGEGIGYFGLGTTLAMAIAPGLGVWIVDNFSFSSLFMVATASQILALLCLTLCSIPDDRAVLTEKQAESSFIDKLIEPKLLFQALLALLFGICIGGVLNFIALLAQEAHIANAGAFFLMCTLCIFLSRLVTGRIFDQKGPAWVILPGTIIFLLGFVVLAQSRSMTAFLTASALYGFGYGTIFPAVQTWMFNLVPPVKRSAASATFYNMIDVGNGVGSIALGMLAGKLGYASIYWCSAIIMGIFLLSYIWFIIRAKYDLADNLAEVETRNM